jgi:hypothetical protein
MGTEKMDSSTVYSMFEEIKEALKQGKESKPTVAAQPQPPPTIDLSALATVSDLAEQLNEAVETARKPLKHEHRHVIDITSSRVFLSLIGLLLAVIGLAYFIGEQRETISQYRANDLKYRYVKMRGKADEESIYRLERQFRHGDSIKIIRIQVEQYEELVLKQAERIERAKANDKEMNELQRKVESVKGK